MTLTTILVSSCIVKPFESPTAKKLGLSEQYRNLSDTTNNIAQTPWRDFFVAEELQKLIDTVLAGNSDYQSAVLRIEQSYAMLRSARAQIAPSIGASASIGHNYSGTIPSNFVQYTNSKSSNAGFSLNWEIDLWGKLYARKESAKADFWQTEQAAIATRQSLIAAVATSYATLISYDTKLEIVKEAINNRTEYYQTTLSLKESGKVNEVAVQQAYAQLEEVKAALSQIDMAIEMTENAIALLAGRQTLEIMRNVDIEDINHTVSMSTGTPAQLLSFRPDVRMAEMNYRSKHYLFMASRASLYPSLSISGDAGVASLFSAQTLILNGIGSLTAPLFQGRKLRAAKQSAEVEAKISELEFRNTLFTAIREVNDAMISIKSYDAILGHQILQVEALRKAYEYSGDLFMSGYANYTDLLIAQTSVYSAELGLIDTYLSTVTSRIELFRALGGGSDN